MYGSMTNHSSLNTAILGASGYTGIELVRLLLNHPAVHIKALSADKQAGKHLHAIFPNVTGFPLPLLQKIEEIDFSAIDVVFCCLPHAASQQVIKALPQSLVVIDLSADFRLFDIPVYEKWYGTHHAPELQENAVYGLTEWYRDAVQKARLIANPGCYPTTSLLALLPLLEQQLIDPNTIIIDAKSGVSGAGRSLKEGNLACEVMDGIHAYGIGAHRHLPEIEQGCSWAAGQPVSLTFTPHLMPMNRGILATIYTQGLKGITVGHAYNALLQAYQREPFVQVLPMGTTAATRFVRGSNSCHISVHQGCRAGQIIIVAALDNLVKGASGQAVQNMNVRFGFAEDRGLARVGVFP